MTKTDAVRCEQILKSMVPLAQQNFTVVFNNRKRKTSLMGTYLPKTRVITIYLRHFNNALDTVGAGLHELAHHLVWCHYEEQVRSPKIKHHGKEFRRVQAQLIGAFNFRYRELLQGKVVFDARRPRRCPRFVRYVPPEQEELEQLFFEASTGNVDKTITENDRKARWKTFSDRFKEVEAKGWTRKTTLADGRVLSIDELDDLRIPVPRYTPNCSSITKNRSAEE